MRRYRPKFAHPNGPERWAAAGLVLSWHRGLQTKTVASGRAPLLVRHNEHISIIVGGILLLTSLPLAMIAQTKSRPRQKPPAEMIHCTGDDRVCFYNAVETCRRANVTSTITMDIYGTMTQVSTSFMEVRGKRNSRCMIYYRTEKNDLKFSANFIAKMKEKGASQQQIEEAEMRANQSADTTEGLNGVCGFKLAALTVLVKNWKAGLFSTDDWKGANCRGTMFDQTVRKVKQ